MGGAPLTERVIHYSLCAYLFLRDESVWEWQLFVTWFLPLAVYSCLPLFIAVFPSTIWSWLKKAEFECLCWMRQVVLWSFHVVITRILMQREQQPHKHSLRLRRALWATDLLKPPQWPCTAKRDTFELPVSNQKTKGLCVYHEETVTYSFELGIAKQGGEMHTRVL